MKLRLFIFALFAIIIFVAYQKYSEYSALKSINSYESCIAAKDSLLQESYPATCITRLGSRFTQSITPPIQRSPSPISSPLNCRPRPNCNADNTYCDRSIALKLDGSINWCPLP